MKKTLACALMMTALAGWAQQTAGEIAYDETIDLHRRIPAQDAQMKAMIPPTRTIAKILRFDGDISLYVAGPEAPPPPPPPGAGGEGRPMRMMFNRAEAVWYLDQAQNQLIEQRVFFERKFLIQDELPVYEWKLTGKQKQVLNFVCQEATFQDSLRSVSAWFTTEIPVPIGPEGFGQLPGLILEVDLNQGERVIKAREIKTKAPDKALLAPPSEGKTVTREEFRAMVDQKMKEMQSEMGGNGGTWIIRRP
ncbi:MAG: GLPGLI family protein [Bacteroidia bacterium]|nr:GLPGLI family protein [Bacteroidia bacterium]